MNADQPRLLNLGCGSRYRVDLGWTNIDFTGTRGAVMAHDLARGIPFPDGTFDMVYHSHLLEHFPRPDAAHLMRECFRALKEGGICRVAVPNLEELCRQYLASLESVVRGEPHASDRYRWMLIELLDQLVRHRSGGDMAAYLQQPDMPERAFVIGRIGNGASIPPCAMPAAQPQPWAIHSSWLFRGWRYTHRKLGALRREALRLVLSRHEMQALEVGLFRLQGESHLWMYDHYSLREMMQEAGFGDIAKRAALSSGLTGWNRHGLDTNEDGSVYKPDSLYMEGVRNK